jgi:hemerythrin-like domain-containing protein
MRSMATMSMNRVIHGAIRRDLERFEGALTTFKVGDGERAKQLGVAWENFDTQLKDHHEGEHEIAWPALQQVGVTREMLEQMDAEHATMAQALGTARSAMAALVSNPGADESEAALTAVKRLRDVTVTHLDHEEEQIEPVYLEQHDSPAMKDMGKQFAKAGPSKTGPFMAWITDGTTPEMQQGLKENVPRPVVTVMAGLFGRSYRKNVAPVWKA